MNNEIKCVTSRPCIEGVAWFQADEAERVPWIAHSRLVVFGDGDRVTVTMGEGPFAYGVRKAAWGTDRTVWSLYDECRTGN